jgi:adenosylmethionine-8-amino-7-oxononanoate aminotransferase/putative sterol carrier protein
MSDRHASLARRDLAHLIHPVTEPRRLAAEGGPRVVTAGDGCWITDDEGRRLIDGFAGLWCVTAGHGRREIVEAVREQMERLAYHTTFHGLSTPPAIELAEKLASMFPPDYHLDHVMFASGGSEANETLFKIVRLYWHLQGQPQRDLIVSRTHGYHGLTLATMAATGIRPMHWNFGPEPAGFTQVAAPYCYRCELDLEFPACRLACADRLEALVEESGEDRVAAFVVEPVIGAGGIIPPPEGYFQRIREICDRHGILLVSDEVVCGFGRTGHMFGFETYGFRPDMVTLAKGLTSGYLPLGASVVSREIWSSIAEKLPEHMPFSHGFTYMGHPACCAAALANLRIVEEEDLPAHAALVGAHLLRRMQELRRFASVGDVRGVGLMVAVELVADKRTKRGFPLPHSAADFVTHKAWELGLYCRSMGLETVGLAPPLTIDVETADRMVDILAAAIEAMEAELLPGAGGRAPTRRVSEPREFFEEVLPAKFDPSKAEGVDLVVQLVLDDEIWVLEIAHGKLAVSRPTAERSDTTCTVRMSRADYVKLANGDLGGDQAFMTGRLRFEGNMAKATELLRLGIL